MSRERLVAQYHGAISVRVMTSQGAVIAQMLKEVDVQRVLLRSLQFYLGTMKTVGVTNKKLSEMRLGPELGWI